MLVTNQRDVQAQTRLCWGVRRRGEERKDDLAVGEPPGDLPPDGFQRNNKAILDMDFRWTTSPVGGLGNHVQRRDCSPSCNGEDSSMNSPQEPPHP